jgi:CRP-like cAMP-binding protein
MTTFGSGNDLLEGLPAREANLFAAEAAQVVVRRGEILADARETAAFVYFPSQSVLSLVGATEAGATVEVAVVGREGVASVSAAFGPPRLPFRVVVQVDGTAWRLPTAIVSRELRHCGVLHERLFTYSHQVIAQVGQSAVCNRFHNARQRLARWLLMTADRADSRELPLTHEFISYMVGGPRSAVTEAAAALRASGAIEYRRGRVTIRDLPRLRQLACECYETGGEVRR